jgi:hypothetical protein
MHRLMVEENARRERDGEAPLSDSELPKPCDYFDLIGGTSTGGCIALYIYNHLILLTCCTIFVHYSIIALMLGHLWMDVDKAIKHYSDLAKEVFSDMKRYGDRKFKAKKLKEAIQSVVETVTGDPESPLLEGDQAKVC